LKQDITTTGSARTVRRCFFGREDVRCHERLKEFTDARFYVELRVGDIRIDDVVEFRDPHLAPGPVNQREGPDFGRAVLKKPIWVLCGVILLAGFRRLRLSDAEIHFMLVTARSERSELKLLSETDSTSAGMAINDTAATLARGCVVNYHSYRLLLKTVSKRSTNPTRWGDY
jgi:hypothetical protein